MRVTQGMLTSGFLRNLSESYERFARYQDQLTTGKKISKPSQDPVVAMMGIEYRGNLNHIEQYRRNLSTVHKWMDSTEDALSSANAILQRVNELIVQASNGTYEANQRFDIGKEIEQLKKQMATVANTQVAGKYIFNGTETSSKPVDLASNTVSTNTNAVEIAVNDGITIRVNIDPTSVFDLSLFQDLENLQNDLQTGASEQVIASYLPKIQQHLDNVITARSELGARGDRVSMITQRLGSQHTIATKIMSNNEDADIEKVIMNLKMQESVHRAALSAGARIMQPTLLDFLR
ncbi:MAG TPA: flagellar hook-associated protein FlgL [Bacillales bacterium]|nr:flagellar hook-associated protein FlgL [Bacillales bacterium]